jgi:hypothetical protein
MFRKRGDGMAIENNNPSFTGYFIADVLEVDRSERKVSVYIPKFMPGMPGGQQVSSSVTTTTNPNITGLNYNTTIKIRNSMWVYPWNFDDPLPKIGSKVSVFFIDGNPKTGYWQKFNPNNNYEVIDEERYPKLFNLDFSGSLVSINTEDNLTIEFPSNYSSVYNENDKNKTIRIIQKENYVVSEEEPSDPFNGLMWFKESTQDAFIYKAGSFKRVIFQDDLQDLYRQVEEVSKNLESQIKSSRLLFTTSLAKIADPIDGQFVVIDSSNLENGFYKFTILDPVLITTASNTGNITSVTGNGTIDSPWLGTITLNSPFTTADLIAGDTIVATSGLSGQSIHKVVQVTNLSTFTFSATGWKVPTSGNNTISNLKRFPRITKDGYYFFSYEDVMRQQFFGQKSDLEAYRYTGSYWEPLDGWFDWIQPASIGDLGNAQNKTLQANTEYNFSWTTFDYLLKITRFQAPNFTFGSAGTVNTLDVQLYTKRFTFQCDTTSGSNILSDLTTDLRNVLKPGDLIYSPSKIPMGTKVVSVSLTQVVLDANASSTSNNGTVDFIIPIGSRFQITRNADNTYTMAPSFYQFYLGEIPDISRFGVVAGNIFLYLRNIAGPNTSINLGSGVTITARDNLEL